MTGPNGYGQHPADPRQRQPGTWPPVAAGPTQPGTWPPVAAGPTQPGTWPPVAVGPPQTLWPAPPGVPESTPTPPRRRSRRPLIIGAVVVAAIAAVVTGVAIMHRSNGPSTPAVTVVGPMKREYFMPDDPAAALATAAELKDITQLDLATTGAKPVTVPAADQATVPTGCSAAVSANNSYVVGDSSQFIGQQFADTSGDTVFVGLAFWDRQEDAWMSTAKLGGALMTCSHFVVTGAPGAASSTWNITDSAAGLDHSSWTATREGGDKPLKCYNHYFVNANVGAIASLCTANPSTDAAKKIDELMMDKATNKH